LNFISCQIGKSVGGFVLHGVQGGKFDSLLVGNDFMTIVHVKKISVHIWLRLGGSAVASLSHR
jgi:hypothetical protein